MTLYNLGFDDTDSFRMGCTTYAGARLIGLLAEEAKFTDYPNLIRLNPNIPWKSRGNAAICLRFETDRSPEDLLETAREIVEECRDAGDEKNQPGIALLKGEVPGPVKEFGRRALYDVLSVEEAARLAERTGMVYRLVKGGRGLIGAVAAIGNTLDGDYTFELIVYRRPDTWGRGRDVDPASVVSMDRTTSPLTFNNFDYEKGRVLITPHGPDPILFGVRGEDPAVLLRAMGMLRFTGAERWVIYRSNQGTDAHLTRRSAVAGLQAYQAAVVEGRIASCPRALKGGHIITSIQDGTGRIDLAAYEPSGDLRRVVRCLLPGDRIMAGGGVRLLDGGRLTFNLERLEVLETVTLAYRNPVCERCRRVMKSEGKDKGYQCEVCGLKTRERRALAVERRVKPGTYLPPPRSQRHLTKPFTRYGLEKTGREDGGVGASFYGLF